MRVLRISIRKDVALAVISLIIIGIFILASRRPLPRLTTSDVAAWVQAVGSITAIAVAVQVVRIQHQNTMAHSAELDRRSRKQSLNRLIITLQTIATAATEVSHSARNGALVSPELESAYILEARRRLLEIPSSDIPDVALLLKVDTILLKLHRLGYACKWLHKGRAQKVRDGFATSLEHLSKLCFLAVCDGANLLNNICTKEEVDEDWKMIDQWKENHKRALSIMDEVEFFSTGQDANHSQTGEAPADAHSENEDV